MRARKVKDTMYQLFIYLQPTGDLIWLWQRRSDGAVQQQGQADSLSQLLLPSQLSSHDAVLVLPTEWVLLQPVTLPKGATAAALPLLLEDQLFVDIDQQHWHECSRQGRQRMLAMVGRAQLNQWRAQLLDQGLVLTAVVPDCWLLPDDTDITLLRQGERLLVRGPQKQGWALPVVLADQLVTQLRQRHPQARMHGYGLDAGQQQRWGCGNETEVLGASLLTARWQGDSGLLPTEWQPQDQCQKRSRQQPLWLAAAVMMLVLVWLWLDNTYQSRLLAQQQQQLAAVLSQYPQLQSGPELEAQLLDQRLAQQQRQQLASQLSRISGLLRKLPAGQLNRLQLDNGQLQLQFNGLNAAWQQQLNEATSAQGYQLTWQQPGRRAILKEHIDAD